MSPIVSAPLPRNFERDLVESHIQSKSPVWFQLYQHFFGNNVSHIESHPANGWHQQQGIDRTIHFKSLNAFPNCKSIWVEEKTDHNKSGNVAVEEWADLKNHSPGWITKPIAADFLLYTMPELNRAWLFSFPLLQMAWSRYSQPWRGVPFRPFTRTTTRGINSWTTSGLIIPPRELSRAIYECSHVENIDLSSLRRNP